MSINVKKYTKDQMAKMVEDAQAEVQELTRSVAEKNALRNDVTKMVDRAAFECGRADYAESHPWWNLWAWLKRKLKMA